MKDIFVSLEIAKKLKEIGFNEPCIAYYYLGNENELVTIVKGKEKLTDNFVLGTFTQSNYAGISAPTYEQVFKWFREKGIYSEIRCDYIGNIITFDEEGMQEDCYLKQKSTYEEARENLILEMIELLKNRTEIKNKLNKNE